MKTIDTLIPDVQRLFDEGHKCDPERVSQFGRELAETVATRLREYATPREPTLRMSNLGKPDRQLWYDMNDSGGAEDLTSEAKLTFLYGDILEALLLFLAEEAGHSVIDKQKEVELDGIKGHIDAVIDGVVVDVKSASKFGFQKFEDGSVWENDPFGYVEQLAGYAKALDKDAAWWAVSKERGKLTLLKAEQVRLDPIEITDRIDVIKEAVSQSEPPERCYDPIADGKSGNMKLPIGCSYCRHKFKCWADANNGLGVRTFIYSDGPRHLVTVENEPRVPEVFPTDER